MAWLGQHLGPWAVGPESNSNARTDFVEPILYVETLFSLGMGGAGSAGWGEGLGPFSTRGQDSPSWLPRGGLNFSEEWIRGGVEGNGEEVKREDRGGTGTGM